jgi:hypothetical protein
MGVLVLFLKDYSHEVGIESQGTLLVSTGFSGS